MKNFVPSNCKFSTRVKAFHRLARLQRWPGYAIASVTQDFPTFHIEHNDQLHENIDAALGCLQHVVHSALVYLSFTLIR